MSGEADNLIKQYETCYLYNESFNYYYKIAMTRRECEEFVVKWNECKGGHWEVRRKIDVYFLYISVFTYLFFYITAILVDLINWWQNDTIKKQ